MLVYNPTIQKLNTPFDYKLDVLRLDMLHESISGNKWFKLKYNLQKALDANADIHPEQPVITFGGEYSNHIAATSVACKLFGLKCVGIIRGEEKSLNPTLIEAIKNGMQLEFVSRDAYSKKNDIDFKNYLQTKYGNHYLIPEGGNNLKGVLGCTEIIKSEWKYDYVLCACGTGTTYAGIVSTINSNSKVLGISVLKGENKLPNDVELILKKLTRHVDEGSDLSPSNDCLVNKTAHRNDMKINGNEELEAEIISENCITSTYSFNGYANYYQPLIDFKNNFETQYNIPLDYVYNNKLFFAAFDLMLKQKFKKNANVLVIHSGGLQGNRGFEERFIKKP
jgi:1-aminocyclopropane-1-carboxylate deaminase